MWIWSNLIAEYGLLKEIVFEKLEVIAEDVIIILWTFWERVAELGIDMKTRIAFHANVGGQQAVLERPSQYPERHQGT